MKIAQLLLTAVFALLGGFLAQVILSSDLIAQKNAPVAEVVKTKAIEIYDPTGKVVLARIRTEDSGPILEFFDDKNLRAKWEVNGTSQTISMFKSEPFAMKSGAPLVAQWSAGDIGRSFKLLQPDAKQEVSLSVGGEGAVIDLGWGAETKGLENRGHVQIATKVNESFVGFMDSQGKCRAKVEMPTVGEPRIVLNDKNETTRMLLHTLLNKPRVVFSDGDGSPLKVIE